MSKSWTCKSSGSKVQSQQQPAGGRSTPAVLLKIYIYGYLNRIQASRRPGREAQRNVELMWHVAGRLLSSANSVKQPGVCPATLPTVTGPLEPDALRAHHEAMWTEAASIVEAGGAALDPRFAHLGDDARRGLTLLARPTAAVADGLAFLEGLRAMEPEQYYQCSSDCTTRSCRSHADR